MKVLRGSLNSWISQLKRMQGSQFPTYPSIEMGDQEPVLKKHKYLRFYRSFFALRMCSMHVYKLLFLFGLLDSVSVSKVRPLKGNTDKADVTE